MRHYYRNLILEVPLGCYEPAEDSELLAGMLEQQDFQGKRCLDMGCGTGLQALVMALQGGIVTAVDINPGAVAAAAHNAQAHHIKMRTLCSDLFAALDREQFDVIVFNAPYLPQEADEPSDLTYSGGATGRAVIERFLSTVGRHLTADGQIFLVISSLTGEDAVAHAAVAHGLVVVQTIRQRVAFEELIVMVVRHV